MGFCEAGGWLSSGLAVANLSTQGAMTRCLTCTKIGGWHTQIVDSQMAEKGDKLHNIDR